MTWMKGDGCEEEGEEDLWTHTSCCSHYEGTWLCCFPEYGRVSKLISPPGPPADPQGLIYEDRNHSPDSDLRF